MLKSKYAIKGEIPEGVASFYVEKDGAFILDADFSDHPTVIGLRDNRDAILTEKKKALEDLKAAQALLESVKAEAGIADLSDLSKILKGKQSQSKEEEDKRFNERVAAMKAETEKQIKELTEINKRHEAQLQVVLIDNALTAEATKHGVRHEAMQDVLLRGRSIYRLVDGKPTPMEGEKVIYGKDGFSPKPIGEWFGQLTVEAPHLFNPSQGGGAEAGAGARRAGPVDSSKLSPTDKIRQGLETQRS